jgi:cell division protein FtsZ
MGLGVTQGLGAGSQPEVGRAAAEEVMDEVRDQLAGSHMAFITAGMGGGTGTGAAPVIARAAREMGILTVGVVTKPFQFEGLRRMRVAEAGVNELQSHVDTLIVIPNQNLFRVANEKTTFADAFAMADQVLYSGVACITDLMVKEGLINLDFADVRAIMRGMGKAMMGTGEASGEKRANRAAEAAIANPLLDEVSMKGARGLLISITGGRDLTLYELDEAATRIREEVDQDANIILGATFDESLEGTIRVSVVATGIDHPEDVAAEVPISATEQRIAEVAERLRAEARMRATPTSPARSGVSGEPLRSPEHPASKAAAQIVAQAALDAPPATTVHNEVVLSPAQPKGAGFEMPARPEPVARDEPEPATTFVPPPAERVMRTTRMPRVEELPVPGQRQLRAAGRPDAADLGGEKKTLLQRLANVGFGRREETTPPYAMPEPVAPAAAPAEPAPRPVPAPASAEPAKRAGPAPAFRAAAGNLDAQGRMVPVRASEDDQLEIPAFLRRSSH